jgi:hypothetical protein
MQVINTILGSEFTWQERSIEVYSSKIHKWLNFWRLYKIAIVLWTILFLTDHV